MSLTFALIPVLLILVSLAAGIFLLLLLGYAGLLLVKAVFRGLQQGPTPAVFVPPQPVRPVQPLSQPQLTSPAAGSGLSFSAAAALGLLGVAAGVALMLLTLSARRVEYPPPTPVVADRSQPEVQLAGDAGEVQASPQAGKIPLQPESAGSVTKDGQQAAGPAAADRAQLLEVASQLGQFFQSQLNRPAAAGDSPSEATGDQEVAAGTAGESADGDVVVYQFSEQMLADLFGSEAIDTLRSLSQQMPAGIRNSYALIPLPGSVGATVPPMKPLLASSGLRSLADSLVQLLKTGPADPAVPQAQQAQQAGKQSAVSQPEIPAWVRQPAAGHRVARAEILPGDDVSERVRESVEELLQAELRSAAEWIPARLRQPALLASVGVSTDSVRALIRNRFERLETLEQPIDGAQQLQVIWTEIELPRVEILGQLSLAAGERRSWLLAAGVLVFWLGLVLAAISSRLWAGGRLLSRFVSFGSGVLSIALLVAVVLVGLRSARGLPLEDGQLFNGAVVWSGLSSDIRVSL